MAVINGTSANDFIHMAGDGQNPGGLNEIDTVTNNADTIKGNAGNDIIFGAGGGDSITGDDGADTIMGGQGGDRLFGGLGNDVFRIQGISDVSGLAETINGGNDVDTLDFSFYSATGAVDLSLCAIVGVEQLVLWFNDVTLTSAQLGGFSAFFGQGGLDRFFLTDGGLVDLTGASFSNIDEIRGNALANQVVLTGVATGLAVNLLDGDDQLTGGDGNDRGDGGAGNDTLAGGLGNDSLLGGDDDDRVLGAVGNDTILGGAGADSLEGAAGNDSFRISFVSEISGLAETITGGIDFDSLDFQSEGASGAVDLSNAVISGIEELRTSGTEVTLKAAQLDAFTSLVGSGFADRVILSGAGSFDLTGAFISSIDEFRGSGGNDGMTFTDVTQFLFIDGLNGSDTIRGGLGNDLIEGGNGADTLNGSDGVDTLRGEQGADSINGGLGNDQIQIAGISDISGLAEVIDGGNDVDVLDFQALGATGRVDLTLATLSNLEVLKLSGNTVTMTAAQIGSFETIQGSGFLDIFKLAAAGVVDLTNASVSGIDEFDGTSGADTFLFAGAIGTIVVAAGAGADSVSGGDNLDSLLGGNGNDTLDGGLGDDYITGGAGTDSLTGGLGVDRFLFTDYSELGMGAARDVIADFTRGIDLVDLTLLDSNLNAPGNQPFVFIGSGAFTNAGELRYAGGVLSGDTDGDGTADFQIAFAGNPIVTASDILL